jgi:hypothetical protein
MTRSCSISCPSCRQTVEVSRTERVTCQACGAGFEVGVYSPHPERLGDVLQILEGLSISGNWLQIRNRVYPLTDIVGTSFQRLGWGWRPLTATLLLVIAAVAGSAGRWLVALGLGLLVLGLLRQMLGQPQEYVVSWITRDGREDRQCLRDRETAHTLLNLLRAKGKMPAQDERSQRNPARNRIVTQTSDRAPQEWYPDCSQGSMV